MICYARKGDGMTEHSKLCLNCEHYMHLGPPPFTPSGECIPCQADKEHPRSRWVERKAPNNVYFSNPQDPNSFEVDAGYWVITKAPEATPDEVRDMEYMLRCCLGLVKAGIEPRQAGNYILAAPDLLAAVKKLESLLRNTLPKYSSDNHHVLGHLKDGADLAKAAIAKAEKGGRDE